jgi:hypothetical protein
VISACIMPAKQTSTGAAVGIPTRSITPDADLLWMHTTRLLSLSTEGGPLLRRADRLPQRGTIWNPQGRPRLVLGAFLIVRPCTCCPRHGAWPLVLLVPAIFAHARRGLASIRKAPIDLAIGPRRPPRSKWHKTSPNTDLGLPTPGVGSGRGRSTMKTTALTTPAGWCKTAPSPSCSSRAPTREALAGNAGLHAHVAAERRPNPAGKKSPKGPMEGSLLGSKRGSGTRFHSVAPRALQASTGNLWNQRG